ncbi:MAG: MoaD/ThiS family protein [Acidobacteria bacterium]|nr:MoaD/ThiS family protein [Acidobacteriota bacterium]MCB9396947.1 MoaD/ThiS family protein [Acidobacteriota bacterium]
MQNLGRYELQLFASLRERLAMDRVVLELQVPISAQNLLDSFFEAYPQLSPLKQATRLAVAQRFARPEDLVEPGFELVLIPPVSGG